MPGSPDFDPENRMSSSVSHLLQTAVAHHQSGRLRQAEAIYRSVLGEQPDNPNALYLLGVMATVGPRVAAREQSNVAEVRRPSAVETGSC